jgi:hypothetical protein
MGVDVSGTFTDLVQSRLPPLSKGAGIQLKPQDGFNGGARAFSLPP